MKYLIMITKNMCKKWMILLKNMEKNKIKISKLIMTLSECLENMGKGVNKA